MMQGHQGGRWENLGALARSCPRHPEPLRPHRAAVGGAHEGRGQVRQNRHRTEPQERQQGSLRGGLHQANEGGGNGWEFSQQCVKLLQDYKRAHPWVFAALQSDPDGGFEGLELDVALKHLPEPQRLPALNQCKAWIKAQPLAAARVQVFPRRPRRRLSRTSSSRHPSRLSRRRPSRSRASPLLLMQPVRAGEVLDLYAGGEFDLGDRVVMVGDSGSPPFGTRGFICAVHGERRVMFDCDFVGATDLHGVLPEKRGAMLPTAQLVNLSHPPAMPQLGTAAPDQVIPDKKGKKTLPKGFKEAWNEANKGGGKGVLAMAAALLPGKGGLPAPSAPAPGPRIPIKGSKGFEPGMGRGRGVGSPGLVGGGGGPGGIVAPKTLGAPGGVPDVLAMLGAAANATAKSDPTPTPIPRRSRASSASAAAAQLAAEAGANANPAPVHAMSLEQLERRVGGAPRG